MMIAPRTALFLPASRQRAIARARSLHPDLLILDLEDAVAEPDKASARAAAVAAVAEGFAVPAAIRVNGGGTDWHAADLAAVAASRADLCVLPKAEDAAAIAAVAAAVARPVLAMIETPAGVLAAPAIAAAPGVAGLIAGTNDLAHQLRVPGRAGLALALQAIVLAARAAGGLVLDGVWNRLDDPDGLAAECAEGRSYGFDGKTLIHPDQIAIAEAAFAPDAAALEEAAALVAAATGGAARFRGRMVEAMHVEAARALLARATGKRHEPRL
ncbi:HpcH/HpaI aldolase/citrate lyase family protein [Sphingomonas morindae]|uniref:HpcH/HpaI aldolase/citrate lyase family protein n=1 Tax=Sphingomonas morindae TaxID=1541170 RepID=A0ABY4X889_9SPHN|nr:aldolase/citrate lyase family protein [Sphingomonas morindae]USI73163.1 HpcH/HpaI aldolase/citrate lyase family protein [Sphingomonas morindae]